MNSKDIEYMRTALSVARRGMGRTSPNPAVGCVLVKNDVVIARGWTGDGGRPHAEAIALEKAGAAARGASAYVTLEPCSHHGQTGPCAEALIEAGVARVVVACGDPDPRVSGRGIEMLRGAGVEVVTGVLEDEARELNKGFILRVTENRPLVTLKIAMTNDGMITAKEGEQLWITGEMARRCAHMERSKFDAVLVGVNTVLIDGPLLTTRIQGVTHSITRVILDSHLRTPVDSAIVRSARDMPLWIFHDGSSGRTKEFEKQGVELFTGNSAGNVVKALAERGITRLQVEGGAKVLKSFAEAGLCDEFQLYRAPTKNFPRGKPAGFEEIRQKLGLKLKETRVLGEDLLEIYGRGA